jgi:hypothetical protein
VRLQADVFRPAETGGYSCGRLFWNISAESHRSAATESRKHPKDVGLPLALPRVDPVPGRAEQLDPLGPAGLLIFEACAKKRLKADFVFSLDRTPRLQAGVVPGRAGLGVPSFELCARFQVRPSLVEAQESEQGLLRQTTLFGQSHQSVRSANRPIDLFSNSEGTRGRGSIRDQSPGWKIEPVFLTLALGEAALVSDLGKRLRADLDMSAAAWVNEIVHDAVHHASFTNYEF